MILQAGLNDWRVHRDVQPAQACCPEPASRSVQESVRVQAWWSGQASAVLPRGLPSAQAWAVPLEPV